MTDYIGADRLRGWLQSQGFKLAHQQRTGNGCNWYAYRASSLPARECERNDGKRLQVVVRPFRIEMRDVSPYAHESVEVDVTGEAGGRWYKLMCYSMRPDELIGRLDEVEASLVAAWNALQTKPAIPG